MDNFLKKLLFFISLQLLIVFVVHLLFWNSPLGNAQYLSASIDKRHLLSNPQEKRLIVIGGSNVALGIDSRMLQTILGRNPVNIGLSALVGPRYMTAMAAPHLRRGDVVILSLEYEMFGMKMLNDLSTVIFAYNPTTIQYLSSLEELKYVLDGCFSYLGRVVRLLSQEFLNGKEAMNHLGIYQRAGFNQYGDFIAHWKAGKPEIIRNGWPIFDDNRLNLVIDLINEFHDVCKNKGVVLLYLYPPYPASHADKNPIGEALHKIRMRLEQGITVPLLQRFEESLYEDAYFYDSCYHLNHRGTVKRTQDLAHFLEVALNHVKKKKQPTSRLKPKIDKRLCFFYTNRNNQPEEYRVCEPSKRRWPG
jgi:hypothetical protein